jgi:RNA polymerase-binding transcription factor DksA
MEQEFTDGAARDLTAPVFASEAPIEASQGDVTVAPLVLDLDAIETDLADVEIALARLESGTYWTCEITGVPLDDELLATRPTARRATDA